MNINFKNMTQIMVLVFLGILSVSFVLGAPTGPTSTTVGATSRYPTGSAANVSAIAGNVTELNFAANVTTSTWQGYYGNVTGKIVLGNANNRTLYDWNLTNPTGEIYATRTASTPTWSSIRCANSTEVESEDVSLGAAVTDADTANKTFLNTTTFTSFFVGSVNINTTQNCRAVNLNDENGAPSSDFAQVLLSDNTNFIYTALVTAPALGFDNVNHQFQMIVGENGHNGDTSTTPYYFYLELT
jgi:hypothetical protein